ncbi:hypothetical protein [Catellatospora vulcania]|uniref:hypothetical protein n=1 Tax=Catellatospora vulcania TaxID=1460450 RepID=UPI0012D37D6F|nr:hypothetical protein [Catellatospora vulcania]
MSLPRLSPAGWTIAAFGLAALLLGAIGLISPTTLLASMGFTPDGTAARAADDYTLVFVRTSAMASFNMGVYYLLAAAKDWTAFFAFTVAFRLLTFTVFTGLVLTDTAPAGFLAVAAWEGAGALATLIALRAGRRAKVQKPK